MGDEPRDFIVRTSDRGTFKRCRRQWELTSPLRQNRTPINQPSYFWLGTGGHFAMEDYHGYNYYNHPVVAFHAYTDAYRRMCQDFRYEMPDDWEEQVEIAEGILEYYLIWLDGRDPLKTYWVNGEPQVEVECRLVLPIEPPEGYDRVVYGATLDRVVEIDGELWVLDYKFFKSFHSESLDFNAQMSAYCWIASTIYDMPIAGAIYEQHLKTAPKEPRILSGGKISSDKSQQTTHRLYRQALQEVYEDVRKAPKKNIDCLNDLAAQENEYRDKFIRRDYTVRNWPQIEAEGTKILMEIEEMTNPDLPLYPNPTKDCTWDCSMRDICLMMDRDDDWHHMLEDTTVERVKESGTWRDYLE